MIILDLSNNPLSRRGKSFESKPKIDKNILEKYGEIKNLNSKIFEKIDLEDRKFVNRLDDISEITANENFKGLIESIKEIGLINPIYLLERDERYTVVSGWRRSLALSQIFLENKEKVFTDKVIILSEKTPIEILENLSIDENTKRKDLSVLELSYKFNKLSETKEMTVEQCLELFKIGKSQYHAIKKSMEFEPEIKEILDEIGAVKGDLLNKIFKIYKRNKEKISLSEYCNKTRDELKEILNEIKNKNTFQKENISIKRSKSKTVISINKEIDEQILTKILELLK